MNNTTKLFNKGSIFFPKKLMQSLPLPSLEKEPDLYLYTREEFQKILTLTQQYEFFLLFVDIDSQPIEICADIHPDSSLILLSNQLEIKINTSRIPRLTFLSLQSSDPIISHSIMQCIQQFKRRSKYSHNQGRTHFYIQKAKRGFLIPIEDIYYFLAQSKYIVIRHKQGQELMTHSLKTLEEELSPKFIRVHRNALVSTQYIATIQSATNQRTAYIEFKDISDKIDISQRKIKQVRSSLKTF